MQIPNVGYQYYQNDAIGTPQRLVNKDGTVTWSADYSAFGETTININTVTNPLRFAGQFHDTESGLYQNYMRDYDPQLGAYTTYDPYGPLISGLNRYSYVGGDPVSYTDPTGELPPIVVIVATAYYVLDKVYTGYEFLNCGLYLWDSCMFPGGADYCNDVSIASMLGVGVGRITKYGTKIFKVANKTKKLPRTPDFRVDRNGNVFPIPKGVKGPVPTDNGKGVKYIGGQGGNGLHPDVSEVRFMDPKTHGKYPYPNGYVVYGNSAGKGVNPRTGVEIPNNNPLRHIPIK